MMDSKPILPEMFHPQRPWRMLDGRREVKPYTRTARPVKYYFVDFGLATFLEKGEETITVGRDGQDQEVPELSDTVLYKLFQSIYLTLAIYTKEPF